MNGRDRFSFSESADESAASLVGEILRSAQNGICASHGFFSYPLGKLDIRVGEYPYPVATDGTSLFADEENLVSLFSRGEDVSLLLLHPLLHCLFLHPFREAEDREIFSLAADVCVFCATDEMGFPYGDYREKEKRKAVYKAIIDRYDVMNDRSAEKYLSLLEEGERKALASLFTLCDHSLWEKTGEKKKEAGKEVCDGEEFWMRIALQTFSALGGEEGTLKELLSVCAGKRMNYLTFLRRFLKRKERKGLSADEFDLNYYVFGLSLYGNLPLIENTETKDDKRAEDLVVAIDTSGSTKGKPVRVFLEETRSVVEQTGAEEFGSGLRIIQCDDRVRSDTTVRTRRQFDGLMESFTLVGGGGTDFRPVFDLLEKEARAGKRIRGLVYFTDGVGVFPKRVPPFPTAFVLFGKQKDRIAVPKFAYKLSLE